MKKIAVFPGTFDPFTVGHEGVVKRGLEIFDEIIIAVGANPLKKCLYSVETRKKMISKVFQDEPRIKVDHYEGLTVDYCRKHNAKFILRGLRTAADFEFERAIAQMNRIMAPDIESVFILTIPEHAPVNSTIIRDIIRSGGDASMFVPSAIKLSDYIFDEES
ncbi:MAG: pantetheine-phosphate adenylyltransferase [Bacteroidales bacterium]